MKSLIRFILLLAVPGSVVQAQITTPIIKANFGVEADLRSNFFNGLVQSGNDDWFLLPGTPGTGQFMVDTAGAASILAGYTANPNSRKLPFYRTMRYPAYSVVNNRLLVDAYFVRDYHGDDSTVFASGSNKNGMSPADWTCPESQSIPDKNEILDMMLHVRRAGPNVTDSMWMFGGISIENTTGNRYFDFEMYQTDIYYDRATRRFYNYGPDAGHTRWQFDASGNMQAPGDIILTAEYSSAALTMVEARIWIDRNDLLINPVGFNWTGSFDGANTGSQYGYAGIQPESAGAYYTGLQSGNNTWAGAFSLVLGDNSVVNTYTARQFMEFSVNLSKLGLDQAKIFGGDDCLMPFRRVIVKTRASTSFTAELKDFIAPFDFFIAPAAKIETQTPMICDTGSLSNIYVMNPIPTSIYEWSTINGHILGSDTGPSIFVDTPGVYIVKQYLQAACSMYATDTITIGSFGNCNVLARNLYDFRGTLLENLVRLNWKVLENQYARGFFLERSTDGIHYSIISFTDPLAGRAGAAAYETMDDISAVTADYLYYRVRFIETGAVQQLSPVVKFRTGISVENGIRIMPNPARDQVQVLINSATGGIAGISVYDQAGKQVYRSALTLQKGNNRIFLDCLSGKPDGLYQVVVSAGNRLLTGKVLHIK
ncbi:MAG: T9SS type A sorting domain-containing protein [Sphingobacteriales bacterium]|nr:T9SS type A sorting domain-containing protein [Sphingobacteriales bacterium]